MTERLDMIAWVVYFDPDKKQCDKEKAGKWILQFYNSEFGDKICQKAVDEGIVAQAKHSNAESGVCCFYVEYDDNAAHKRCIKFFLDNDLIRKAKTGRLYNISYKLDEQTRSGEYGNDFKAEIKLADFLDPVTREWLV